MAATVLDFDVERAIGWLLRFLAVEGVTGHEAAIGQEVVKALGEVGVPGTSIAFDTAHERIPHPTQTGNLIVKLAGTRPGQALLFMTHLDTVPLCAGAVPLRKGQRIVPAGETALGADNRTGVATLVNLIANLVEKKPPHPPLTFLFTVREESGLWGARFVDLAQLGPCSMCFNVDGRSPREITIGAVGADRWEVAIQGKASHAGVAPQAGISATMVAALALAEVYKGGWFGKIKKKDKQGTSNVGSFGDAAGKSAGVATNVVTDFVKVRGEARSHDRAFISAITQAYKEAFQKAAAQVCDDKGKPAKIKFHKQRDYFPFKLKENSPVIRRAQTAAAQAGWEPLLRSSNGGLDANWMVLHKIPTISFGAGQHNPHTIEEYADLAEFAEGCRFALALATQE